MIVRYIADSFKRRFTSPDSTEYGVQKLFVIWTVRYSVSRYNETRLYVYVRIGKSVARIYTIPRGIYLTHVVVKYRVHGFLIYTFVNPYIYVGSSHHKNIKFGVDCLFIGTPTVGTLQGGRENANERVSVHRRVSLLLDQFTVGSV